jgi:soluble lytic murein transglycosylase-like protein
MRVESDGKQRARSSKGAMGLMQIMPGTWSDLHARYGLGADPYDIHDKILAGAAYIRELHDRYGTPGFLAAYNAGPGTLRTSSGDRLTAAGRDADVCRDARTDDQKQAGRRAVCRCRKVVCLGQLFTVRDAHPGHLIRW